MHEIARLKKGWEFDLIFRTGVRVNGDLVRLLYLKDSVPGKISFGCTVSKKLGKAHIRNRGRRIMRAAFYELAKSKKILPGLRLVLSLRTKGLDSKSPEILRELEILFARRKLFIK